MMKKFIALCVVLSACGGGGEQSCGSDYYSARAENWQGNESQCPDIQTFCPNSGDFFSDLNSVIKQLPRIRYERDGQDVWKASCQTLTDLYGDCDDTATLAYRAISDSCLMDNYGIAVGVRVIEGSNTDHVVAVVYHEGKAFEVDSLNVISRDSRRVVFEF